MSKPPNFILFITDQQRADFLGCYGHPVLRALPAWQKTLAQSAMPAAAAA